MVSKLHQVNSMQERADAVATDLIMNQTYSPEKNHIKELRKQVAQEKEYIEYKNYDFVQIKKDSEALRRYCFDNSDKMVINDNIDDNDEFMQAFDKLNTTSSNLHPSTNVLTASTHRCFSDLVANPD